MYLAATSYKCMHLTTSVYGKRYWCILLLVLHVLLSYYSYCWYCATAAATVSAVLLLLQLSDHRSLSKLINAVCEVVCALESSSYDL